MARMTLETFATRVAEALGPRLVTLLLYGSAARQSDAGEPPAMNTLLLVDRADADVFARLGAPVRDWVSAKDRKSVV